jgi:hypothetical protein
MSELSEECRGLGDDHAEDALAIRRGQSNHPRGVAAMAKLRHLTRIVGA